MKILAINPGSTSTKLAAYENNNLLFEETIRHNDQQLMEFANIVDQLSFRMEKIKEVLQEKGFPAIHP